MVFDPENEHRRRSSLVLNDNDAPRISRRRAQKDNPFSCVVHNLLPALGQSLGGIDENGPGEAGRPTKGASKILPSQRLTKKQLSAVTVSARNLAKKLASVRVKGDIKSIFLLTKIHDDTLIAKAREVVKWLLSKDRDSPYVVWVEDTLKENKNFDSEHLLSEEPSFKGRLKWWNTDLARHHPHTFDFVVTLGGDGTVLYASWLFQRVVPPVLSFALGSLGFLTKFDFEHYSEILSLAFRDGVTINLRLRFEGTIMRCRPESESKKPRDIVEELIGEEKEDYRSHEPERSFNILNDIVVDRGPNPSELLRRPWNVRLDC